MTSSNAAAKKALRKRLRQQRRSLSIFQQHQASKRLQLQLQQSVCFQQSKKIALYLASDGELSCHHVIRYLLANNKQVFLPVLHPTNFHRLLFVRFDRHTSMRFNRFGIEEPRLHKPRLQPMHAMDIICLPLVGFDESGNRLGMGGGFYDRSLERTRYPWVKKPKLIGLAHELQLCQQLPTEPWDIKVSAIATDRKIRWV